MSTEITVTIKEQDGRLLWSDFSKAIRESIAALDEVAGTLADSKTLYGKWRILNLSMNSPVMASLAYEPVGQAELPDDWFDTFIDGMAQLENGVIQPRGFGAGALQHVGRLADLKSRIEAIEYEAGDKKAVTSAAAATNATAIRTSLQKAKPKHYYSVGELRGALEEINVHGGARKFSIWDRVTGHQIVCEFSDDPLRIAELITRRIAVSGRIAYDRNDNPVSIKVEHWEPLKAEGDLASLDDIRNALERLPDGMSSEDFIRSLRDDE